MTLVQEQLVEILSIHYTTLHSLTPPPPPPPRLPRSRYCGYTGLLCCKPILIRGSQSIALHISAHCQEFFLTTVHLLISFNLSPPPPSPILFNYKISCITIVNQTLLVRFEFWPCSCTRAFQTEAFWNTFWRVTLNIYTGLNQNQMKAPGPDGLMGRVLKVCAPQLGPVFARLFHLLLDSMSIPRAWKTNPM